MNPVYFKAIGIGLNVLGALILAFRVKGILDALAAVAHVHEENIQQLMRGERIVVNFVNAPQSVARAQKFGTKLLFVGFICIVVGNLLNAVSLFLT